MKLYIGKKWGRSIRYKVKKKKKTTNLRITTTHGDIRIVEAIRDNADDPQRYSLTLTPNKDDLNRNENPTLEVMLQPDGEQGNRLLTSAFKLPRGLYDVTFTKLQVRGTDTIPGTDEKYTEPVMVGEKHKIKRNIENAEVCGINGVKISVRSEVKLDSETVYYTINREKVRNIKYYIPFEEKEQISFFIKGVEAREVQLHLDNLSFEITD